MELPKPWKIQKSEYLVETPWLNLRQDTCELPTTKDTYDWYVVERTDVCGIFAITAKNEIVVNYQYRHAIQEVALEQPLGAIDEGEDPQTAALRELEEETGYQIHGELVKLPVLRPNPGINPETLHLFIGFDAQPTGTLVEHPTEEIVNELMPIPKFDELIASGKAPSMWVVGGWHIAKSWIEKHKPELL